MNQLVAHAIFLQIYKSLPGLVNHIDCGSSGRKVEWVQAPFVYQDVVLKYAASFVI